MYTHGPATIIQKNVNLEEIIYAVNTVQLKCFHDVLSHIIAPYEVSKAGKASAGSCNQLTCKLVRGSMRWTGPVTDKVRDTSTDWLGARGAGTLRGAAGVTPKLFLLSWIAKFVMGCIALLWIVMSIDSMPFLHKILVHMYYLFNGMCSNYCTYLQRYCISIS